MPTASATSSLPIAIALAIALTRATAASAAPVAAAEGSVNAVAELEAVTVQGHYDNTVGGSEAAASEGSVTRRLIANRPALRPGEVLEFVPGVIVTQHSGDGKANQYFLRGFNLDHGTDFATFVDGMPINAVSHAHGQGYTDLNFLIPELIRRIDYRKGPYRAQDGDFANAGSARIALVDRLERQQATLTLGERGYARTVLSGPLGSASPSGAAADWLYALEAGENDGPWTTPEGVHRFTGVLRRAERDGDLRTSLTAMAYASHWRSTDQIPQRAVDDGRIGRFDAIDPSDGGRTSRFSLSGQVHGEQADGFWEANAYAVGSRLSLWSDFTYALDRPDEGDQFQQAEQRRTFGGNLRRQWRLSESQQFDVGLDLRHDRLSPVGLYDTVQRLRTATVQEARVRETLVGLWAEHQLKWTSWLRQTAGLRLDHASFKVDSSLAPNSGRADDHLASPKFGLVFGPWAQADQPLLRRSEFFLNYGQGFHSNDARGTTAQVDADGQAVRSVPGLVKSRGSELGLRSEPLPGWQASLAWWRLKLDSELVYVGDAGTTEASRGSSRHGLEINQHVQLDRTGLGADFAGWLLDLDFAASKARYVGDDTEGIGNRVPGAVDRVLSFGLTYDRESDWFGHFQLRHLGPRDLLEDGSQRSRSTTLAYLRGGYRFSRDLKLTVDVFNLFNQQASDIDYFYGSCLKGEACGADGLADRHFHPVEPRSLRVSLSLGF